HRQSVVCNVPGDCTLDLDARVWIVRAADPAHYAAPQSVTVTDTADAAATMEIVPTTPVKGRWTLTGNDARQVSMLFRSAALQGAAREDLVTCSSDEQQWTCNVPRGEWDLRFGVRGYAAHYFPHTRITAQPLDLGTLTMAEGASLVGRVDSRLRSSSAAVMVSLTPMGAADPSGTHASANTKADARGFFQFSGLAPGEYLVEARTGAYHSEARRAVIVPLREATLREPLVIAAPARITIAVTGADASEQWSAELVRSIDGAHNRVESLGEQPVVDGRAAFSANPGSYAVRLRDANGSIWTSRDVVVQSDEVQIAIPIDRKTVTGSLRLGDAGVAAKLTIRGASDATIQTASGDDGTFRITLPRGIEDNLTIVIDSPLLNLKRTITNARIARDADGAARLDVRLPLTRLAGRVIDGDDHPQPNSLVTVFGPGGAETIQLTTERDGEFVLNGLAPGDYQLRAESDALIASDMAHVTVSEDGDEARVVLTVKEEHEMSGVVFSGHGAVPGARVWPSSTDRPTNVTFPRNADVNGRFAFVLPNGSSECDFQVDAPGFAGRLFHRRVTPGEPVVIRVDQNGGMLRLRVPSALIAGRVHARLLHDGAVAPATLPSRSGRVVAGDDGMTLIEGLMEPGSYALCISDGADLDALRAGQKPSCVGGFLAPFGQLELQLPSPRS
ncbi:MAG TPA: carboxypeptidase-like regulatory domain-containing protein, partial [Thermoanaerobaculia bacterium]|nr:carboxypeptidase-like regulatory domain-containing protein [Thermoanaerobaculia bacterium]